jgi:hypothetical protein
MALHLWKVKVRTEALTLRLKGIVEEVKTKVEEGTRDRLAINCDMLLLEVPATRADNESR